uniref:Uncharacterized protein n=1 Tax=Anguilla anguilla TaxID=7936 RepID=A0A0E9XI40_ANGAN
MDLGYGGGDNSNRGMTPSRGFDCLYFPYTSVCGCYVMYCVFK